MKVNLSAAIESITVLGLSAAASLLLIAGLAGAVTPQTGSHEVAASVAQNTLTSGTVEQQIVHLPAIEVIGTRAALAAEPRASVTPAGNGRGRSNCRKSSPPWSRVPRMRYRRAFRGMPVAPSLHCPLARQPVPRFPQSIQSSLPNGRVRPTLRRR